MELTPVEDGNYKSRYDIDDYENIGTIIRWYECGQGRVSMCYKSYLIQLRANKNMGYDMPKWTSLPVKFNKGVYFD